MHQYWSQEEKEALKTVATFEETAEVAIAILARVE